MYNIIFYCLLSFFFGCVIGLLIGAFVMIKSACDDINEIQIEMAKSKAKIAGLDDELNKRKLICE